MNNVKSCLQIRKKFLNKQFECASDDKKTLASVKYSIEIRKFWY